jgi:IPT/TIG domain
MLLIPSRLRLQRLWILLAVLQLALIAFGCGGGAGSQQQESPPPPPPATPDFSLAAIPTTATVFPNNATPVAISATAVNGFTSQISVQVTGLPAGVSAAPASFTLAPGTAQNVLLSASASASANTTTATFTGTSGSLSHSADVNVSVSQQTVAVLPTRTRYDRSDAVTEYGYSLNTHWELFHNSTSRFFVTDPYSNRVFVFDSTTETEIGSIVVPGAYGIDQTPDGSTLYVGTLIGDVYTIDPVSMTVTQRYLASQIGPSGYQSLIALPLSSGSIVLLGAAGGIPSVDGSPSFAVWNPTSNSITIYGSGQVCNSLGNIGGFALSVDRTTVILGGISGGGLCEVNATTGQSDYTGTQGSSIQIVLSPDGNYLAVPIYPTQVVLYNAHTLAELNQFTVAGDTSSASNLVFSADSQTLFVPNNTDVYAYNAATGKLAGWLPNIVVEPTSGGGNVGPAANPNYEVYDNTGLLVGPAEEGLGFLDTTTLQTGPVDSSYVNGYLTPATGPTSGGTQVQWSLPNVTGTLSPTVYFGGNQAPSASVSSGTATVTTPSGDPGPVPVYLFVPDGGMQLLPDGFSYGPSILEVTPNLSTADGGGSGVVYGYGFGPTNATTLPANLSVTVGGVPATILGFIGQAYNTIAPPFPLQAIVYTIPPGSSGSSAEVTVTSSSGGTSPPNALSYLPATQQYPLPGSQLAQGIYDPVRDVYYFTDANQIQVFSLTQGQWLSPISIPAPAGATQRLWGIALSPDGTKLAVTDAQADVIYLINPSNPSSIQTFPGPSQAGVTTQPAGIAVSDAGIVYFTVAVEGVSNGNGFYQLDTTTGALTVLGNGNPGLESYEGPNDLYQRTEISSDNSHVFFNNDGFVFNIDTATDAISPPTLDPGCCYGNYDLALSSNQAQFEASSYLYDLSLDAESFLVLNDRESLDISYVYGAKLSPDGTLLFQPSTNGIDVYDGRLGILLNRIALPFALSTNYDALVEDGQDNRLIAITGTNGDGIAVVDLTSINEPAPLPYAAARRLRSSRASGSVGAAPGRSQNGSAQSGVRVVPHVTRSIFSPSQITDH